MPWRHQAGRFACGKVSGGFHERGHPIAQGPCVLFVQARLPHASLLQGWWPPLHLELGRCIVPHESEEVFLGMPLLPSCHRRTRSTSEPFHGKVKKQLRFRAQNTCIQQLIQQQWLCSTIDTTVAVTRVDVLHLHPHHRQTRVRTSLQPPRSTAEGGGGLWARPPVLSPVLLASEPQPQPSKNTGQKLLNNNTAFKSKKDALIDTAPAESPRSLQQSSPGSVVPDHPRSASRQVHVHPCCRLTPVRALQTTSPATSATISSRIYGTGTSTICCTMRFDIHSSGITLITSTLCSRICCTGTSTICSPTRFCTRSHGTCCTPSKICSTGSGRSGAPSAPNQYNIETRFGPNND